MFRVARAEIPPPPLPPTPQQERGKAKRRALYDASVRAFAASGFEDARVEDIVAEAGVSWGTFYRYFPRKEDVLLQMGVEHWARVQATGEGGGGGGGGGGGEGGGRFFPRFGFY
jgi:AcrR family transcriptional regulator